MITTKPSDASPEAAVPRADKVGQLLVGEADTLERELVRRLIDDPEVPRAVAGEEVEIADHLSAFLAAVGATLASVRSGGPHPELLSDGSEIQQMIAYRHGRQRRRLEWERKEVEREYQLLRELLDGSFRLREDAPQPSGAADGVEVLHNILEQAKAAALAGFDGGPQPESSATVLHSTQEALESIRVTIAAYRRQREHIASLMASSGPDREQADEAMASEGQNS